MTVRFALALFLALLTCSKFCSAEQISGKYQNSQYAYSVDIPRGQKGSIDPPPAPQHGFRINFPGSDRSFIWLDASYNSGDQEKASEILEQVRDDIGAEAVIQSVSRSTTRLGTLAASGIVIRYQPHGSRLTEVRREIVAFRLLGDRTIVYTAGIIVPAAQYPAKRSVLEQIVRSFRLQEVRKAGLPQSNAALQ